MSQAEALNEEAADAPRRQRIEHVFRWDLDKTYLATEFDRIVDLVKTALQKAEEKRNVPGAVPLLRALLRDSNAADGRRRAVYFISGSPRQMRKVLTRKLELDGIRPDAFVLKPNLRNLLRFRFRALRGQVGYKLRALLEHQVESPKPVPETLFGDDAEQDAIIYSIYAEVLAGRMPLDKLEGLLRGANVYDDNIEAILEAAAEITPADRVERIYIILDRKSPPMRFEPYMPRLVPVYNYFQAALCLFQDGLLRLRDLVEISLDMIDRDEYNPFALTNSMQDVVRRGHLKLDTAREIGRGLETSSGEERDEIARRMLGEFAERVSALEGYAVALPEQHGEVDYAALLQRELAARKEHGKRSKIGKPGGFFDRRRRG